MIREDNVTLDNLVEDLRTEGLTIKEYLTRSEGGSHLFTTALNKILLNNYTSHPKAYTKAFTVIQNQGKDVKFPRLHGINPAYVPELSEIPFATMDITSITVSVEKFGLRVGISQEMIDDNEVGLAGWIVTRVGVKMAELEDQEAFKALHTYCATGAVVDTTVRTYMGSYDRGKYYTTGSFTNQQSATSLNWEDIINTGMGVLQGQTITILGDAHPYPVYPKALLIHPAKSLPVRRILQAPLVSYSTGVGDTNLGSSTLLAGTNVLNGMLQVIETPYLGKATAYLCDPSRGSLVFLQRQKPIIDQDSNFAFDAKEVRARSRFIGAVVEERGLYSYLLNA